MEVTRTIQIQVTRIYRDIPNENLKYLLPESEKRSILERFAGTDQVLVEVKDFIRDGDTAETHQN